MLRRCERCGGQIARDLDGDLACYQCGARVYATPPLPYLERGSKYDHGPSSAPDIKRYRDTRRPSPFTAYWRENGKGAA